MPLDNCNVITFQLEVSHLHKKKIRKQECIETMVTNDENLDSIFDFGTTAKVSFARGGREGG